MHPAADRGNRRRTQRAGIAGADAPEAAAEDVGAYLVPHIRLEAAAAAMDLLDLAIGRPLQHIEQQPRGIADPLHDRFGELGRPGGGIEADEHAARMDVPQRRPLALQVWQEQRRACFTGRLGRRDGAVRPGVRA